MRAPAWRAGAPLAALLLAGVLLLCGVIAKGEMAPQPEGTAARDLEHPIAVLPPPPALDERRRALGERLFADPRLSGDGSRACASPDFVRATRRAAPGLPILLAGAPQMTGADVVSWPLRLEEFAATLRRRLAQTALGTSLRR